ncbi:acylphosphatase [Oceanobacillus sp. ISL-74]|uniref:acylphosphatase n=1 Tax=Oceanobacillus sp. ISL-74 TaxID=2819162 RepID=UPI001BE8D284|nr:acylphosphatase [Oceanobacillus sp. ISL-74]MBT2599380.1 acylphosphatase [Oceanobacillus sp. ISL-74]
MKSQYPIEVTNLMTKGIKGFNLCAFLIGLEGWRRGLKLKYYGDINEYSDIRVQGRSKKLIGRSYSLESTDKIHYFNQSRGDKVSNDTVKIVQSKQKTKEFLKKSNVPILESIEFRKSNSNEEVIEAANQIGYPVIIKPTYGSLSRGVSLNIKNDDELAKALSHVRGKLGYKRIILEKYFMGDDIRLYVIEDKVVASLKRLPARVKGDGINTIKELIQQKNESRKGNPYLEARPIKIDDEVYKALEREGYTINDILEKDKTILVKNKSTMDQGVELYDITDQLPSNIKQIGINALKSFPNIVHGSIDMLFDGKEAVVLEINASANISMHMFPNEGTPRNIGAYLMDFYFPETKGKSEIHYNMYFDFLDIVEVLKKNYTNYIEVKSLPHTNIHAKKYIVSGKVQKVGFRKWIRREAIRANLHGYTQNLANDKVEVVVANEDMKKVNAFQKKCGEGPKKAKVETVESYNWEDGIKVGFEIVSEASTDRKSNNDTENPKDSKRELIEMNNQLRNEIKILQRENKLYKQKYETIEKNIEWIIVKPVKKIVSAIRKNKK